MYKTKCCNSVEYSFQKQMIGINEHFLIICKRCNKRYHIENSKDNYDKHKNREVFKPKVENILDKFFDI